MSDLKIEGIRARAVEVPMKRPLATASGSVSTAPLVLIDLETTSGGDAGPTGRSYVFGYGAFALGSLVSLVEGLGAMVSGQALAPLDITEALQARLRLLGPQGLTGMAVAGIDMAAWDALAKAQEMPLARLLGGAPRPLQTYNSKGLGLIGVERAGEEARALVDEGFGAVKVRLGYATLTEDLAVLAAVRHAVGDDVHLMSDYNQGLTLPEAQRRVDALDEEAELVWVEEPVRFDDYQAAAEIRTGAFTPIQLGENCWGPPDMAKALEAECCDFFMPDVVKIGGVSGWLQAIGLATPRGLPLSSHLYPEISAHLMAVTPTRHWLEMVDWAEPILAKRPLRVENGQAILEEMPGVGLEWDEDAVARFAV